MTVDAQQPPNAGEGQPQQPPAPAPPAPAPASPPSPPTLTLDQAQARIAELEKAVANEKRSYDGLQGTFNAERTRARELAASLDEKTRELTVARADLAKISEGSTDAAAPLQAQVNDLLKQKTTLEATLAINDAMSDPEKYPGLNSITPTLRSALRSQLVGKEGDDLIAAIDGFETEIKASGFGRSGDRQGFNDGRTPDAPPGLGTPAISFNEMTAQLDMLMRTKGVRSPEYTALKAQHDEMVKAGQHKS